MEKVIHTLRFGDAFELRQRLNELIDLLPPGGMSICGVEQYDARDVRAFQVLETTLSDGSKTYDIRFLPWLWPLEVKHG